LSHRLNILRRCLEETESDYVTFSNFNVDLIDRKMSPLCGNDVITGKTYVVSDGNFFRVTFWSNGVYDAVGFSAYYQFRVSDGKKITQKMPETFFHARKRAITQ